MTLIRITPPALEPVTLQEMKNHMRVDYTDEDDLINQYISAARQKLEQRCGRSFVEQTWELRTSAFESSVEIPKPPTMEIVQVTYLDEVHVEQTVNGSLYALVEGGEFESSTLIWLDSATIPNELAVRQDAARVRFKSGWAVADVPWAIKQAMLFLADHLYNDRAEVMLQPTRQEIVQVPVTVDAFIAPYIVPRL